MKIERLQRLEPYEGKLSRTVLRREKLSNQFYLAVKNIFGTEKHPERLISFLNAILKPIKKIISVEIKGTDIAKQFIEDKYSRLDVKATTSNNEIINIEIQLKE